jgi:hypothetical protein
MISCGSAVFTGIVFQVGDIGMVTATSNAQRNRFIGCRFDTNAGHGLLLNGTGGHNTFSGCFWGRNSCSSSNLYDHINAPAGGTTLNVFTSPTFANYATSGNEGSGGTVRYCINDVTSSVTYCNLYTNPFGDAGTTGFYNITGYSSVEIASNSPYPMSGTTPSVVNTATMVTANGSATSVTALVGGVKGQRLVILNGDAGYTTLVNSSSLVLSGSANLTVTAPVQLMCTAVGIWTQITNDGILAPKASPTFTGTLTAASATFTGPVIVPAPPNASGDNSTHVATTAYVDSAVAAVAPGGGVTATKAGALRSGLYYFTPGNQSTYALLAVNLLRLAPIYIPTAVTLSEVGAEITVVGDAGCTLHLALYRDINDGTSGSPGYYPGALVADWGTVPGDSVGVHAITISTALIAGVYWIGAAVQGVTTTQPTVRVINGPGNPYVGWNSNSLAANNAVCYTQANISGAPYSTFTSTASPSNNVPRIYWKV